MVPARFRLLAMNILLVGLAQYASADPPGRVARLSYISGSVSIRPASVDAWSAATRNYPLTTGDHMWTDRAGDGVQRLEPRRSARAAPHHTRHGDGARAGTGRGRRRTRHSERRRHDR